jgi:hypothetical protein
VDRAEQPFRLGLIATIRLIATVLLITTLFL